MVKTLRFYSDPNCDGCEELRPAFKEIAKLKGWKFKEIDLENCRSKRCGDIEYTPTVYVGRKKLNFDEMDKLLDE